MANLSNAPRLIADESMLLRGKRWNQLFLFFGMGLFLPPLLLSGIAFGGVLAAAIAVAIGSYVLYQAGLRHKFVFRPASRMLEEHQGILFQSMLRARMSADGFKCVSTRIEQQIVRLDKPDETVTVHVLELVPTPGPGKVNLHIFKTFDKDDARHVGSRFAAILGLPLVLARGSRDERTLPAATLRAFDTDFPPPMQGALRLACVNFAYFLLFMVFGSDLEAAILLYACMAALVCAHLVAFEILPTMLHHLVTNPDEASLAARLMGVLIGVPLATAVLVGFWYGAGGGLALEGIFEAAKVHSMRDMIRYIHAKGVWPAFATMPILYILSARFAYDPAGDRSPFRLDSPLLGAMAYLALLVPAIAAREGLGMAYGTTVGVACAFVILVVMKSAIDVTLRRRAQQAASRLELGTD